MTFPATNSTTPAARQGAVRPNRLAQAVSFALALCLVMPTVGAADAVPSTNMPEAASQAQLEAIQSRLPDLGHDGESEPSFQDSGALLERALGAVAAGQVSSGQGRRGFDPSRVTDEVVRQAANAGLSEGLRTVRDSGLPFLGSLQGNVTYDNLTGRVDF